MAADAASPAWLSAQPPPAIVLTLLRAAAARGFGQSCAAGTGAALRALAASKPGGRILNLGTGVGVSCAWPLDGMSATRRSGGRRRPATQRDRRAASRRSGAPRGRGRRRFLERASAAGERYDLIFADAMPGKYERPDLALGLVAPGGWYVSTICVRRDDFPEAATWAPALVDRILGDSRFVVVTLDWASGLDCWLLADSAPTPSGWSRRRQGSAKRSGRSAAEPGGAAQAALGAEVGRDQAGPGLGRDDQRRPELRNLVVEARKRGQTAAEHDRIGIEQVDDPGERHCQPGVYRAIAASASASPAAASCPIFGPASAWPASL